MTVTLYSNKSEPERMNKTIQAVKTVEVKLLTLDTDVIDPVLELSGNVPTDVNYFYVPTWKRYYYAKPAQLANGMYRIEGHVDVLMSFRGQIEGCTGIAARNAKKWNAYIADNEVQSAQNLNFVTKAFPKGFRQDGVDYVLVVAGN